MVQNGEFIVENGQILVRADKLFKRALYKYILGPTKRKIDGFIIQIKQDFTEK